MAVNQAPLTPLTLLKRTASVYPARVGVVYGERRTTFAQLQERVFRLANALLARGLRREDRVAVLAPNVPLVLEAHYGIPWAGGVIVAINTRLNAREVAHILAHSGSRVLLADSVLLAGLESIGGELGRLEQEMKAKRWSRSG